MAVIFCAHRKIKLVLEGNVNYKANSVTAFYYCYTYSLFDSTEVC